VQLQGPVSERLVWEFMSSLVVDIYRKFDEVQGYIRFYLFNATHEMHLIRFDELLHLPHLALLSLIMRTTLPRVSGTPSLVSGSHIMHGPPRPP